MNETNVAPEEKKVVEYRLHVSGTWGRNRKPKRDSWTLVERDAAEPALSTDAIYVLVREKVAELKVKTGARVQVVTTTMTIKNEDAFVSRSFMMFSGVKVFEAVL